MEKGYFSERENGYPMAQTQNSPSSPNFDYRAVQFGCRFRCTHMSYISVDYSQVQMLILNSTLTFFLATQVHWFSSTERP
uniref:Alternative protein SPATS2L n=1 Tax=Homo sapiens TaxID=9606 RepID=L8E8P7_HUMAN|nr:alternative protein SPATS2L [Homo sapiens]